MGSLHDSELLTARVRDCIALAERSGVPRFTGFLSPEERQAAQRFAARLSGGTLFYGGYPDAQRTLFGAFPQGQVPDGGAFPVASLTFSYPARYVLTHRDFLGALMSLGLRRDAVGDLAPQEGRCVVFLLEELADYVLSQLEAVGRVGVKGARGIPEAFAPEQEYEELRFTVPSLRLDAVVAAVMKASRENAAELIRGGLVRLCGTQTEKITAQVRDGDTLSVRSHGKYLVDSVMEHTKKGRIILKVRKYR